MADEEIHRALGRIEGKLDALGELPARMDKLDERLRKVEVQAGINGAVAGGIVSIGFALALEKLKAMTGMR